MVGADDERQNDRKQVGGLILGMLLDERERLDTATTRTSLEGTRLLWWTFVEGIIMRQVRPTATTLDEDDRRNRQDLQRAETMAGSTALCQTAKGHQLTTTMSRRRPIHTTIQGENDAATATARWRCRNITCTTKHDASSFLLRVPATRPATHRKKMWQFKTCHEPRC